jgi:hypothetical protein
VLWRIFEAKQEGLTGGWSKLHKEPHSFNLSPNIIRMNKSMRMGQTGHISHMEEIRNGFTILVIKPEWNRPFGKSRHRWGG